MKLKRGDLRVLSEFAALEIPEAGEAVIVKGQRQRIRRVRSKAGRTIVEWESKNSSGACTIDYWWSKYAR